MLLHFRITKDRYFIINHFVLNTMSLNLDPYIHTTRYFLMYFTKRGRKCLTKEVKLDIWSYIEYVFVLKFILIKSVTSFPINEVSNKGINSSSYYSLNGRSRSLFSKSLTLTGATSVAFLLGQTIYRTILSRCCNIT